MQEEVAAAPRAPQQCMGLPCFPWGPARPPPAHLLELGAGFTQKLDSVSDGFFGCLLLQPAQPGSTGAGTCPASRGDFLSVPPR